ATSEVEININSLKQNSNSMVEISNTFNEETAKVLNILDAFNEGIGEVVTNSNIIRSKTQEVTNELHVNVGKIDHIALNIQVYKALLTSKSVDILDENSCRFKKWYGEATSTFLKGNSRLSEINKEHTNVHKGLRKSIKLHQDTKYAESLAKIREVEVSSQNAFDSLFEAVKGSED
ncbi:MAG: chemotaxis protein, partial [Sulfurimonas sp.]